MTEILPAPRNRKPVFALVTVVILALLVAFLLVGDLCLKIGRSRLETGLFRDARPMLDIAYSWFSASGRDTKALEALLLSVQSAIGANFGGSRELAARYAAAAKTANEKGKLSTSELAEAYAMASYLEFVSYHEPGSGITYADASLALDTENPKALYVQARYELTEARVADAIATFTAAIESAKKRNDPILGVAYIGRAEADIMIENYRRAQTDSAAALKSGVAVEGPYMIYIKSCVLLGDLTRAETAIEEALKARPDNQLFRSYAATVAMLRFNHPKAKQIFSDLAKVEGQLSREATFSLGVANFCSGDFTEAQKNIFDARDVDQVLASLLILMSDFRFGEQAAKVLAEFDSQAELTGNPRMLFYRDVLWGKFTVNSLDAYIALKGRSFDNIADAATAFANIGFSLRVPYGEIQWEETALCFAFFAEMNGDKEARLRYLKVAAESPNLFYWVTIIARNELNRAANAPAR